MSQTLARPLAARVANLPEVHDNADNPPVPEGVMEAAFDAMRNGHTHYTDRPGIKPLRTRVVHDLGSHFGLEMNADEVTITCGATEARFVAFKVLAKVGTQVLSPSADIRGAANLIGFTAVKSAENPENVSVLYLTAQDGCPADLLALAEKHKWWIVYDASLGDSSQHPAQNPVLAPQTITIGSDSASLPGWRVGWMAGSQMANKLRAFKQTMTICSTSVSQWAALGLGSEE